MITLNFKMDTRQIRDRLGRIRTNVEQSKAKYPYKLAQFYVERIKDEASVAFTFPTGRTEESIQAVKTKDGAVIEATKNAWYTDVGRKANPSKPLSGENIDIMVWAEQAGMDPWALSTHITLHGTEARPFIRTGIAKSNALLEELSIRELKLIVS